ncbi:MULTISPECIES: bile acid:sodium symporter family protein [unclassified Shewanella]|uniref:bile acid:sodium symporter family protein n=1 Tax=unclassified Shewanella TaxID=196818 RepID=UPI000C8495A6|nr:MULTISPECIES: bile acid:sodium symporter family protein [unclassified Shewanella]MDO6620050.1 bile acid:sodium symporter family protein [Shewanella sp. 6_MG-2023]MDO6640200.1 bile acid:sodium symporter family protein [Shewanella sp. 5_MG-2023]PMG31001.1 bile acid:sodium symporter [Shewanella sp. 10N.286.52.C2]PMG50798.1 bile acid:sodium symporter [Shewanella sp. 10N.286.52.B9]PMH84770.1 bile acid:sodium symporter [Shewanella sp. 10N.286.48.B5]
MEASIFTEVLLPLALAFIMLGMGLSLTQQDFTRLWRTPKPIIVGLLGQVILLPLLALGICIALDLNAALAVGLMILAACPGGTMSNVFSHLAKANLALSVSLTALSTLICVFTTPFIIGYSVLLFVGDQATEFSILAAALGLVLITLLPVLIGIVIRHHYASWAQKVAVYFRRFSLFFMLTMIIALIIKERELLLESFEQVFLASISLNILSVMMGLLLARLCSLSIIDGLTLGIEVGMQNAALAILIAISFLHEPEYAIAAGVYGLTMYIGPSLLVYWVKHFRGRKTQVQQPANR